MTNLLKSILHKSFEFEASSYEVYENGRCIQRARCNTHVVAEFSPYNRIVFAIRNNPTYICDKFSFVTASDDLLDDRVQYGRLRPIDHVFGDISTPIACNIFPQKGVLRFVTPNPLRLVEFSGSYRIR